MHASSSSGQGKRLLRLPEVIEMVGLSRNAIYRQMKAGEFPLPVAIGVRAKAWLVEEVEQWISNCVSDRDHQSRKLKKHK